MKSARLRTNGSWSRDDVVCQQKERKNLRKCQKLTLVDILPEAIHDGARHTKTTDKQTTKQRTKTAAMMTFVDGRKRAAFYVE